jgi:hypothetical protein
MSGTTYRSPLPPPLQSYTKKHPTQLPVIQHNCASSNHILLSLFSSFSSTFPPCIVAIQEPFLFNGAALKLRNYQLICPPLSPNYKIFTCFYILSSFAISVSFVPLFFDHSDFCAISLFFSSSPSSNIYHQFQSTTSTTGNAYDI